MLTIRVLETDLFDEEKQEFIHSESIVLELEHSLVSLSKWESIFEKPFLAPGEKTTEEVIGYIKAMTLTPNISPEVFSKLSQANYDAINEYLDSKMSATWFNETAGTPKSLETITSELIYYWLVAFNIPFEVENWHLNRLFALIKICNIKNSKPKKMTQSEMAAQRHRLNEQRKAQMGTSG